MSIISTTMSKNPIEERVPFLINKSPKYSTWVQPQKWQNDLGSFPKQAIQHHSNPSSVQFSSVSQLCPTLCNLMNRSTPGLPVYHQLPKFTQTHAHWVGDAIQPSHLLSPPSPPPIPPASGSFPMSQLFTSGGQNIGVSASASVLPVNTQDWSPLGWTS